MTNPWLQGELVTPAKMYDRIEARLQALENSVVPWQPITNINSGYSSASSGDYQQTASGVRVRGLFQRTGAIAVNDVWFTLPLTFATDVYRVPFVSNSALGGFLAVSTTGSFSVASLIGTGTSNIGRPVQIFVPLN